MTHDPVSPERLAELKEIGERLSAEGSINSLDAAFALGFVPRLCDEIVALRGALLGRIIAENGCDTKPCPGGWSAVHCGCAEEARQAEIGSRASVLNPSAATDASASGRSMTGSGDATLYLGDALNVLQGLDPLHAHALITDPPYCSGGFTEAAKRQAKGQGLRSETYKEKDWFGGDNMTAAGLQWLLRSVAVAFKGHAFSAGASASFFADWRMVPMLATAIESAGLRYQAMPVWDKQAPGLGTGFRAQHECILHFSIETPAYYSMRFGNVLRSPRMPADRDHPTEKPVGIMSALVEVQAPIGGLVLDPFMGSGSTGVAALLSGRRFVGIEHDPVHFDTACRRLDDAARRPRLAQDAEPHSVQEALL